MINPSFWTCTYGTLLFCLKNKRKLFSFWGLAWSPVLLVYSMHPEVRPLQTCFLDPLLSGFTPMKLKPSRHRKPSAAYERQVAWMEYKQWALCFIGGQLLEYQTRDDNRQQSRPVDRTNWDAGHVPRSSIQLYNAVTNVNNLPNIQFKFRLQTRKAIWLGDGEVRYNTSARPHNLPSIYCFLHLLHPSCYDIDGPFPQYVHARGFG